MTAGGERAWGEPSYELRPPDSSLADPVSPFGSHLAGVRRQAALVAGFGLALPLAAGALGLGLLNGSRRRGVNFFASTWPRALLATKGIRINVIRTPDMESVSDR